MRKSVGDLIDELSVTNIKIFYLVEKVQSKEFEKVDAIKIQELNKYRSKLTNAINEFFGEEKKIKV